MYLVFVNLQKQRTVPSKPPSNNGNQINHLCESYILLVSFLQVKSRVIQT